ncbi:hypothetical protein C492_00130 [Natronococcus jeotgali DSM 18795]|uniref:Uncharacterized protein n=1 Tax=Natronococcus jeotgali DSM 18795 TaxID=1227498 RepID=L9XZU2_9EURY|nr:hypothetical protein C492_00130 [Natronococcus jeotgali DSM 18795]
MIGCIPTGDLCIKKICQFWVILNYFFGFFEAMDIFFSRRSKVATTIFREVFVMNCVQLIP